MAMGAIIGGAVVTSSAMASETTPGEGTGMVVLVNEGESDAIVCVFTDMRDIEPAVDEAHDGDFVTESGAPEGDGVATDVGHADWPAASDGDHRDVVGDAVHARAHPGTAEECGAAREALVVP